jgi:hypothetical protein
MEEQEAGPKHAGPIIPLHARTSGREREATVTSRPLCSPRSVGGRRRLLSVAACTARASRVTHASLAGYGAAAAAVHTRGGCVPVEVKTIEEANVYGPYVCTYTGWHACS